MSTNNIYLDYAATCLRVPGVCDKTREFSLHHYANIGRGSYDLAEEAMVAYSNSKKTVAEWIGCDSVEVLYTYSATYGLNILALALEQNNVLKKGDTILLSVAEHHANIVPWQMLAKRVGLNIRFVGLDNNYRIDLGDLRKKLDDSVKVVSLQYASNVTGAVHPLEAVRALIGNRLFFVDATQIALHGPISMKHIGCDALVFSGHKMYADTGIGVLALRRELQKSWQSPIGGGGAINFVTQEGYEQAGIPERWEPGTPHIIGAVSLGNAIDYLKKFHDSQNPPAPRATPLVRGATQSNFLYHRLIQLVDKKFENLQSFGIQVFHSNCELALGIWSFTIQGKHSLDIADAFAEEGICVRAGHHCCEPLHQYLGVPGTVRISIGLQTTEEEIERFFEVLKGML